MVANVSRAGDEPGSSVELPLVVAESEAADGIRKVFIGGTDAMKFWLVKLVVADMLQYLSNQQVNSQRNIIDLIFIFSVDNFFIVNNGTFYLIFCQRGHFVQFINEIWGFIGGLYCILHFLLLILVD